ncbi:Ail/Lom family outer membrane beta-barrel protein, partial [Yersinia pestis]
SFTYTDLNYDYLNNNVKIGDASFDYYSLMVGPSVHFNEFFSMYALLGIGHGNAKASVLGYGKKEEQDSLAYGVGMQFNPLNNIAIDASYEYTKLKDANIGTWVLGIGYRF